MKNFILKIATASALLLFLSACAPVSESTPTTANSTTSVNVVIPPAKNANTAEVTSDSTSSNNFDFILKDNVIYFNSKKVGSIKAGRIFMNFKDKTVSFVGDFKNLQPILGRETELPGFSYQMKSKL